MVALREDVRAYAGLVVQERALVWVGGRRVHAGAQVDKDTPFAVAALDDGGSGVGAEPRGMDQVVLVKDAHRRRPFEGGKGLVERAPHGVVVGYQAGSLAGTLKEMRERVGAIVEGPDDARGCGNRHDGIITHRPIPEIEESSCAVLLAAPAWLRGSPSQRRNRRPRAALLQRRHRRPTPFGMTP